MAWKRRWRWYRGRARGRRAVGWGWSEQWAGTSWGEGGISHRWNEARESGERGYARPRVYALAAGVRSGVRLAGVAGEVAADDFVERWGSPLFFEWLRVWSFSSARRCVLRGRVRPTAFDPLCLPCRGAPPRPGRGVAVGPAMDGWPSDPCDCSFRWDQCGAEFPAPPLRWWSAWSRPRLGRRGEGRRRASDHGHGARAESWGGGEEGEKGLEGLGRGRRAGRLRTILPSRGRERRKRGAAGRAGGGGGGESE